MKSNGQGKPRFHDLTIEEIKQEKGLENISDEEAKEVQNSLKMLSVLAYKFMVTEIQMKRDD